MSRVIQIRNVPDNVHRKIKARAAESGMTLSDYLPAEVERLAARAADPTLDAGDTGGRCDLLSRSGRV